MKFAASFCRTVHFRFVCVRVVCEVFAQEQRKRAEQTEWERSKGAKDVRQLRRKWFWEPRAHKHHHARTNTHTYTQSVWCIRWLRRRHACSLPMINDGLSQLDLCCCCCCFWRESQRSVGCTLSIHWIYAKLLFHGAHTTQQTSNHHYYFKRAHVLLWPTHNNSNNSHKRQALKCHRASEQKLRAADDTRNVDLEPEAASSRGDTHTHWERCVCVFASWIN